MARLSTVLRSTVFQRVLASSGLFVVLTLIFIWALGAFAVRQITASEAQEVQDWLEFGREAYLVDGPEELAGEIGLDEGEIVWPEDFIWEVLEEELTLAVLRDQDGDVIAGFPGLFAGEDLEETLLDHPEITTPIMAASVDLFDGSTLTVGRFLPERSFEIWAFLYVGSIALIVIALPLSLVTGYFLSRGVFRRLDTLSDTAETVASGEMSARAPLTGTGDEFDRLASGINHMLDRIEALTRNVEAVSVGVAHDLKTPLSNIKGRLELILRDRDAPDAVAAHVEAAEGRLEGLLRVFDAMLRLGEIDAGRRRAAFSYVDLSAVLQDMAEGYQVAFEEIDKQLEVFIDPHLLIEGDRDLLAQMIANLLDNALEHSRDGARAHLIARRLSGQVEIEIGDDGPGIAPTHRDRVFERFYRGDASRSTAGNGLGLALVKAIADLHRAELILLEGRPGAVFVFRASLKTEQV